MGFDKGEKKARMLFEDHIVEFSKFLGPYKRKNEERGIGCYFEEYSKYSWLKITYVVNKKLFSNTYYLDFTFIMDDIEMDSDWEAKLVYIGSLSIKGIKFKYIKGSTAIVNKLNKDLEFISELLKYSREVDVFSMKFQYMKRPRQLKIVLTPYSGGYLWIKFPPIFYPMRFSQKEVYAICKIFNILGKYFIKQQDNVL